MDFLKQNKTSIGMGVLLLVAIYVYMTYFTNPSSPTLTSSDTNGVALSQNLLITLQNLHTIKLDNSIFSDPAFQSLNDFGVIIPQEAIGRRNPFEPLAGTVSSGSGSVQVPLPPTKK
jgi:flagellar capping protein FliD